MTRYSAVPLIVALMLGCSASESLTPPGPAQGNRCTSDDDCGVEGVCYAGACHAKRGDAYPLVLEIVPDPSSGPSGGASFLLPALTSIDTNQPELSLSLPLLGEVEGRVDMTSDTTASCPESDSADVTISAHVTLTRTEGLIGLPKAKYALKAERDGVMSFAFRPGNVPQGAYDLYVEPVGCSAAPLFSSNVKVEGGKVVVSLDLSPATILRGQVKPPEGISLDGWHVDLVEPVRGRVISTVARLAPSLDGTSFELAYRPVQRMTAGSSSTGSTLQVAGPAEGTGSPLVRLRPPDGLIAPTALWDLAAADLSDTGHVFLDMSGMSFTPVHVTGHVEGSTTDHPLVTGAVAFSSLSLSGAGNGVTAGFTVTVPTDERGAYSVSLLPGQYRVVAIPDPALPWAITEVVWQIAETPPNQAGRTVIVDGKPSLLGRARVAAFDVPLAGAVINAVASTTFNPNGVLDSTLGKTPALPRAASNVTDAEGATLLDLDPGLYDLWVRPPETSWLPWFVQPRTLIPTPTPVTRPVTVDLSVPLPWLLGGRAYDANGAPLANALVRAYAGIRSDGKEAPPTSPGSVVQVAETHTSPDGRYKLLLPSKLTH